MKKNVKCFGGIKIRRIFASLLTKINFEMKNLSILLAGAALVAFSFTSCKKDYTCKCVAGAEGYEDWSFDILDSKKGDAEDACTAYGEKWADYDYTCTAEKK